jgi:hypothetical protein
MELKIEKMIRLILILSFFCSTLFSQKVIIVDENSGKEYIKDFPSVESKIPGLAYNLKVYYILQKEKPQYDYLTEKLELKKRFTDSIANGNLYPYCVYEWNIVRLSNTEIIQRKKLAVLQKEMELLMNSVSDNEFKQYVSIALAAMIYQSRGGTLTVKQEEIMDKVFSFGLRAYQNYQVKEQLLRDLEVNPNADITKNWK